MVSSQGKSFALTVQVVAGIFLSGLAMLAALNRRDERVGLQTEIQYDDFAYALINVSKDYARAEVKPQDEIYVLRIKIINHAKRVDYLFRRNQAILVDHRGRYYHYSPEAQAAFDASAAPNKCADPIPAGSSCTTDLVFELPPDARPKHLKFVGSSPVTELLDFIFYGNKRIELEGESN